MTGSLHIIHQWRGTALFFRIYLHIFLQTFAKEPLPFEVFFYLFFAHPLTCAARTSPRFHRATKRHELLVRMCGMPPSSEQRRAVKSELLYIQRAHSCRFGTALRPQGSGSTSLIICSDLMRKEKCSHEGGRKKNDLSAFFV